VPLFVVLLTRGVPFFVGAVVLTFAVDVLVSLVALAGSPGIVFFDATRSVILLSACMAFPVLGMIFPFVKKVRYRLALSGSLLATVSLIAFFATKDAFGVTDMIRLTSDATAQALAGLFKTGTDVSALSAQPNADDIYRLSVRVLSSSLYPMCFAMYAIGYAIAASIASAATKRTSLRFRSVFFYNDDWLFLPLVGGMVCVIIGRFIDIGYLEIVAWNALLLSAVFFAVQGYGIFSFLFERLRLRVGKGAFLFISLSMIVLAFELWPIFVLGALIAGVVELFVPIRARFNNKDVVDPTPGNGGDQK